MRGDAAEQAWAEVEARGMDPEHPRHYRGRILTTIRCLPKGHELAVVYPTSQGPLLVPTASALPLNRAKHKPASVLRREATELRKLFGSRFLEGVSDLARDPWVETLPADDPDLDADRRFIRGLALVDMQDDAAKLEWLEQNHLDPSDRAHFLVCRCGQRHLYLSALREAIRNNVRRVSC